MLTSKSSLILSTLILAFLASSSYADKDAIPNEKTKEVVVPAPKKQPSALKFWQDKEAAMKADKAKEDAIKAKHASISKTKKNGEVAKPMAPAIKVGETKMGDYEVTSTQTVTSLKPPPAMPEQKTPPSKNWGEKLKESQSKEKRLDAYHKPLDTKATPEMKYPPLTMVETEEKLP